MTSVISPDVFNELSHFMGSNALVQFALQPVLIFGVVFHLAMGIYLDLQNRKARSVKYVNNNPGANAPWTSRNMIITGITVLLFLGLHFYDFWIPEIIHKYVHFAPEDPTRYFGELQAKFTSPVRTGLYALSFIFLALHLLHGFQSAFQSVGFRNSKYTPVVQKLGNIYAIVVPLGFIIVAVFHYVTQLK